MSIAQRVIKRSTPKKLLKPSQPSTPAKSSLPQMQMAPVDTFDLDRFKRKEARTKTEKIESEVEMEEEQGEDEETGEDSERDFEAFSSETEGPQEELCQLLSAIQHRFKKKNAEQKRSLEQDMKRSIREAVAQISVQVQEAQRHIDQKLGYVKDEIAKIADGRKSQMKRLQQEYQSFKESVDRTLECFRQDDQTLLTIRNRVLGELVNYNLQFDFPSGKIEALLEAKAEKMRRHSNALEGMRIRS